jgi:hypothetical protein
VLARSTDDRPYPMIECIFTLDYEVYGNGSGSLRDLVHAPAEAMLDIFTRRDRRFVVFVEVSELEMIEAAGSDAGFGAVRRQLREAYRAGFELGLHLHPWWYNGRFEEGKWHLDYSEYNLCALSPERIAAIVDRGVAYLRGLVAADDFIPVSYRAGHLLFPPTPGVARILADRGIRVDSSVYKGGYWRQYRLDYRPALRNGYFWTFGDSTNEPDTAGPLLEVPIHTALVPTWKVLTAKRVALRRKGASSGQSVGRSLVARCRDYLRPRYPLKLDYCAMTLDELMSALEPVMQDDRRDPARYRPIVLIGHTKDLVEPATIEALLDELDRRAIGTCTLREAHRRCVAAA